MVQAELFRLEELRERQGYGAQGAGPFTPDLWGKHNDKESTDVYLTFGIQRLRWFW